MKDSTVVKDWQPDPAIERALERALEQLDDERAERVRQVQETLQALDAQRDAHAAESAQLQRSFSEIRELLEQMRAQRDVESAAAEEARQLLAHALAQRDAEAAAVDRMRLLHEEVLRWAILVEAEARQAGVHPRNHLARATFVHYALWRAVEQHREAHPASAGPDFCALGAASLPTDAAPSLRPWAPVEPILSILGSAAERLARLADLPSAERLQREGFLGRPLVRAEALAYQDAVRAGLTALRMGGKVWRRTHRILQDLAATRRAHDPALAAAVDVLVDALRDLVVEQDAPEESGEARSIGQATGSTRHARPIGEPDLRERILALADDLEVDGIEGHGGIAAELRRRVAGTQTS